MATRLYFPSTTAADVTPAANGAWDYTSEALNRKLVKQTKSNTAIEIGTRIGPWTAGQNALDRRYVSDPISGGKTISGTVKMQLKAREYAAQDNSTSRLEIYVVSNNGSTVRGTLLAIGQYGPATEYINNITHRNKTFADGDTLTSVAALDGDRIVVAVGHSDASGTTPEASCQFGDPTEDSDFPEDETQTSAGVGWIEFSMDIFTTTFTQSIAATSAGVATLAMSTIHAISISAASTAIASLSRISTFSRSIAVSAGSSVIVSSVATFVRSISATALSLASLARVATFGRSIAMTASSVATISTVNVFSATIAAVAGSTASIALATTHALTIIASAGSSVIIGLSTTFFRSISAVGGSIISLVTQFIPGVTDPIRKASMRTHRNDGSTNTRLR